jgi:hypothetical protein
MKQEPRFNSNERALEFFERKLQELAKNYGIPVDALLEEAEAAATFHPDFLEALSLERKVHYFRQKLGAAKS